MKILFLTLVNIASLEEHGIYEDLMRKLSAKGHEIFVVTPTERRNNQDTCLVQDKWATILRVRTGNIQKTNLLEKGISTLMIESQLVAAIKKYFSDITFDLVLYSTPPITFAKVIEYVKRRDGAKSYLLLKDIFPQNAVDLGMISKQGIKSILYRFFRAKEKKLYAISDCIGCMSQANVDYVLRHNPEIDPSKVKICPNSIEVQDMAVSAEVRAELRDKYGIPQDKKVFVYGGNLGRPQGITFVMECLRAEKNNPGVFFLIVGDGTEYKKLEAFMMSEKPENAMLMKKLPKEDYDRLVAACDVGMIFLDYRFTIPNFPSRILSYMQASLPVLACTDPNTDIGKIFEDGKFGIRCLSNDLESFSLCVEQMCIADLDAMGIAARKYLEEHYTTEITYQQIWEQIYDNFRGNKKIFTKT